MIDHIVVVLEINGQAPEWVRLLPIGRVELRDNREPFEVDQADLGAIVSTFTANGVDLVVDYEHQSLTGDKAPAAGWIKDLEARIDGLYVRIEWTPVALKHIRANEYRYYSPVLRLDPKTRHPLALMHVGLTNVPAIKGLAPLLAAKYGGEGEEPVIIMLNSQALPAPAEKQEEVPMLKKLINKLGLKPEATEEEVLSLVADRTQEVVALKAQAAALPEIAVALGLEKTADAATITGTILALKQGTEQLSTLRTELEVLKAEHVQGKAQKAVDEALAAKKITPAQVEWALKYASEDQEGFAAYVKAAVPVLAGKQFKVPTENGKGEVSLSASELQMCRLTGITPEAFKASKESLAQGQA
jgi:phage I-like protein